MMDRERETEERQSKSNWEVRKWEKMSVWESKIEREIYQKIDWEKKKWGRAIDRDVARERECTAKTIS